MKKKKEIEKDNKHASFNNKKKNLVPFKRKVKEKDIDYKNPTFLMKFLGKRNSILSKKYTHLSSRLQRKVAQEIKKSRIVGLMKYTDRQ